MGIVVIGAVFVDIKGFPEDHYNPTGRNAGRVEYFHGGVSRNVAEDIANVELRPTFVSIVDDTPLGTSVVDKLRSHKVDTRYILTIPDGMGTYLAILNETGDLAGSISKRPNMMPLLDLLEQQGDEIISQAESVVLELDLDKEIVKKTLDLAEKYQKKVFALVSNMTIAAKRRDFLQRLDCFICNQEEAGILFLDDYLDKSPEEMRDILQRKVLQAQFPSMVVTMGTQGAVYADCQGRNGICPARSVQVVDTTGAGDAFCAGVSIGLTYGKDLSQAVEMGTYLAASVITSAESVCPRFHPRELGLDMDISS